MIGPDDNARRTAGRGLWARVRSIFRAGRAEPARAAGASASAGPQPRLGEASHASAPAQSLTGFTAFEARLRELATGFDAKARLLAGKVTLIELDKIQARFGGQWPNASAHIHELVQAELRIRLTPQDFYTRLDDATYVIVFGDGSEVEARLKAALLSEQILSRLFGEESAKHRDLLGVETLVTRADGEVAREALRDVRSLAALLQSMEKAAPPSSTRRYAATAGGRRALNAESVLEIVEELDNDLKAAERNPRAGMASAQHLLRMRNIVAQLSALEAALAAGEPPIPAWETRSRADGPAPAEDARRRMHSLVRQLRARADRQVTIITDGWGGVLDEREVAPPSVPNAAVKLEFAYLPFWYAGGERIGIYLCEPRLVAPDLRDLADQPGYQDFEADLSAVIDRMTLRRARQDLRRSVSEGKPNVVAIPIHLESMLRQSTRGQILEMCNNIPEELRKYVVWEILNAPVDGWLRQLPGAIMPLRSFGRAVFLRVRDLRGSEAEVWRSLQHLKPAGVSKVGVDIQTLSRNEARALALLERLAIAAEHEGLKCYGIGFDSISMTVCAVCMGFEHVAGEIIAPAMQAPDGIQPIAMDAIYSRIASVAARGDAGSAAL